MEKTIHWKVDKPEEKGPKKRAHKKVINTPGRPRSSTVICRFDGGLKCDGAEDVAGRGGRIPSRSLADTCGTELSGNRVNELYRMGKRWGYSSFNIPPSLSVGPALMCTPLGKREAGRSVGGISVKTYEKDVKMIICVRQSNRHWLVMANFYRK